MDPALYDSLGGREAIAAAVTGLYDRLLTDDVISPVFEGVDMFRLRAHMQDFLSAALGSGSVYAGRDMATAHAGLHITPEMFDRTVAHLIDVLQSLEVPQRLIDQTVETIAPLRSDVVHGEPTPA